MNKLSTLIGAAMLTLSVNSYAGECPSLNGKYVIGKSEEADFSTINDAINALKCGGVSGSVNFLIEEGKYNEKISLSTIQGADAFNNITFESKSGNNSDVVISYGSGDATVLLNGTAYVNFERLTIDHKSGTYGNTVRIDGKSNHVGFKGVVFNGIEGNVTGANNAVVYYTSSATKTDMVIEDCEINNGSTGILKGGSTAENADTKTTISGTLFFNQYENGMSLTNEDAPVITNNVVSSLSAMKGYKGVNLDNAMNTLVVSNNIINAANGTYGLVLNNCSAQNTNLGQVTNNSIAVGGNGETYGLYLAGTTDNQVLNFNRIKLTITGAQAANQAYYRNMGSGNNINMLNNIFYDLATGGYTIIGNTYKDNFNQLPAQSNPTLSVSANGLMVEKVSPIK